MCRPFTDSTLSLVREGPGSSFHTDHSRVPSTSLTDAPPRTAYTNPSYRRGQFLVSGPCRVGLCLGLRSCSVRTERDPLIRDREWSAEYGIPPMSGESFREGGTTHFGRCVPRDPSNPRPRVSSPSTERVSPTPPPTHPQRTKNTSGHPRSGQQREEDYRLWGSFHKGGSYRIVLRPGPEGPVSCVGSSETRIDIPLQRIDQVPYSKLYPRSHPPKTGEYVTRIDARCDTIRRPVLCLSQRTKPWGLVVRLPLKDCRG